VTHQTSWLASTGQYDVRQGEAGVSGCALQGVGPVEVTRFLWGLAVLDHLPKPAAAGLYDKLAQMPLTSFTAECLDQILQVLCCAVLCCAVLCCTVLCCLTFEGHEVACHAVQALVMTECVHIWVAPCQICTDDSRDHWTIWLSLKSSTLATPDTHPYTFLGSKVHSKWMLLQDW